LSKYVLGPQKYAVLLGFIVPRWDEKCNVKYVLEEHSTCSNVIAFCSSSDLSTDVLNTRRIALIEVRFIIGMFPNWYKTEIHAPICEKIKAYY
jgi:hypothetical protein